MPSVAVECHSGYTSAQRPVAVWLEGRRLPVTHLDAEWRLPHGRGFRVQTQDGPTFTLTYSEIDDSWQIDPLPALTR
jgi:hypothetical protein